MYTDIFSAFDPATRSIFSISGPTFIAICVFLIVTLKADIWINRPQKTWVFTIASDVMVNQVNRTTAKHIKGSSSILTPLFVILILTNLIGLLPYSFRISSHIIFSFSLGIPLWFIIILSAIAYNPTRFLAHLLPAGSPLWLNPFLVLIETLRNLLRPLTLSFRLAANIRAGHIMLTLARTFLIGVIVSLNFQSTFILLFICSFYSIFEIAICVIQAYIFCLLLSLYTDDHPASTESSLANWFRLNWFILYNLYQGSLLKTSICGVENP